ncbi:MAG: hypothetical protein PUE29_10260 [Olsenella sp.]|nr:hypothetical protein [Olsenella sp.]
MQEGSVRVKFGGDISGVDINTFTRVLLDYATVVQASADEVEPAAAVNVSISGAEPGCLQAVLQLTPQTIKDAIDFAMGIAPIVPEIIETANGLYRLKKDMAKHGAIDSVEGKSGDHVSVKMHDGNTFSYSKNTYNVFVNSPEASKAVNSSFETLERCDDISSLSIATESAPGADLNVDRDEFAAMANSPITQDAERHEGICEKQTLLIQRAYFDDSDRHRWQFGWKGRKISANITDKDFYENFPNMSFRKGDSLIADLRVVQEFNAADGLYEDRLFEVVKVHAKKSAPQTMQMDFDDEA